VGRKGKARHRPTILRGATCITNRHGISRDSSWSASEELATTQRQDVVLRVVGGRRWVTKIPWRSAGDTSLAEKGCRPVVAHTSSKASTRTLYPENLLVQSKALTTQDATAKAQRDIAPALPGLTEDPTKPGKKKTWEQVSDKKPRMSCMGRNSGHRPQRTKQKNRLSREISEVIVFIKHRRRLGYQLDAQPSLFAGNKGESLPGREAKTKQNETGRTDAASSERITTFRATSTLSTSMSGMLAVSKKH